MLYKTGFNFMLPPRGFLQCNIVLVLSPQHGAAITVSELSSHNSHRSLCFHRASAKGIRAQSGCHFCITDNVVAAEVCEKCSFVHKWSEVVMCYPSTYKI